MVFSKENIPLFIAIAGYAFTYWHTKATNQRQAQIERRSDQIKLLYGPLLAAVTASKKAHQAMIKQSSPDGKLQTFVQSVFSDPQGKEAEAYRAWMREVLQPLNEKAANALSENADLLETDDVEPLMLQLIAHVSANKVIMKAWESGDLDAGKLPITYPDKLLDYVRSEYSRLKGIQARLMGVPHRPQAKL